MEKNLYIDASHPDETRVVLKSENHIEEYEYENRKKPLIIGVSGGQGTGKTTITSIVSIILRKYFKLNVFKISIDDFYKKRNVRKKLSLNKHPLLMTRGVPGTHDHKIISNFFKEIKSKNFIGFRIAFSQLIF